MYYTYLLRCRDGSLYAGITTDLHRRYREHREGGKKGAKYTRAHPPAASRLEYRLKKLGHADKEAVIDSWLPGFLALRPEELREAEG